jgi:hypothetical protein
MKIEIAAALLTVLIATSLGIGYSLGSYGRISATTTATVLVTRTVLSAQHSQSSPLSQSNRNWTFSISVGSSTIARNQELALSYNLTNITGLPQTVHVVNPLVNPVIYSTNGSQVWAWDPPSMNYVTVIPKAGELTGSVAIPTSNLSADQEYVLSASPMIGASTPSAVGTGDYSIGESLMVNVTITVT